MAPSFASREQGDRRADAPRDRRWRLTATPPPRPQTLLPHTGSRRRNPRHRPPNRPLTPRRSSPRTAWCPPPVRRRPRRAALGRSSSRGSSCRISSSPTSTPRHRQVPSSPLIPSAMLSSSSRLPPARLGSMRLTYPRCSRICYPPRQNFYMLVRSVATSFNLRSPTKTW
jgi:hypothetical protein